MTNLTVANTILAQLGGKQFITMTGARNLLGGTDSLSMRIGSNAKKVTHVKVTLTAMDDYTVEFMKLAKLELTTMNKVEGVYAENLREVFTSNTGLYTSLRG